MNFQSEHTCVTGVGFRKEKSLSCPLQSHPKVTTHSFITSIAFACSTRTSYLESYSGSLSSVAFFIQSMFLRCIPVVACIQNSFPLAVEQYLVYACAICRHQPSVKGHLGGFQCGIHSQHPVDGSGEFPRTNGWITCRCMSS